MTDFSVKTNLTATTAPTIADNATAGYSDFSPWLDVSADNLYFCFDAAAGLWQRLNNLSLAELNALGITPGSHNHAASEITSGTFTDARIAESNVTQHQAALTITESQISDLAHTPAGAPTTATYITQTPDATLSAEQALSLLGTGLVKNTTGTGVLSIAVAGTDYAAAIPGSNNEVLTSDGAGNAVAESGLTFDGTTFAVTTGTSGVDTTMLTATGLSGYIRMRDDDVVGFKRVVFNCNNYVLNTNPLHIVFGTGVDGAVYSNFGFTNTGRLVWGAGGASVYDAYLERNASGYLVSSNWYGVDTQYEINMLGVGNPAGTINFRGTHGGGGEGFACEDTAGDNRYVLWFPGSNETAVGNRGPNGFVTIRANNASGGGGGEVTVATFKSPGVMLLGTTTSPSANAGPSQLVFGDTGTAPTPGTNTCAFYGDDVSGTVTPHVVDEAGTIRDLINDYALAIPGSNNELLTSDGAGNAVAESGLTWDQTNFVAQIPDDTIGAGIGIQNSDGSFVMRNGTALANSFQAEFQSLSAGSNRGTAFIAQILASDDVGSNPIFIIDGRQTLAASAVRPLFGVRSFDGRDFLGVQASGKVLVKADFQCTNVVNGSPVAIFNRTDKTSANWSTLGTAFTEPGLLGLFSNWSGSSGGLSFNGVTHSGQNAGQPLAFSGYHGGTSPTTSAILFRAWKHDGGTSRVALAASEVVADWSNGTTNLLRCMASGAFLVGTTTSPTNAGPSQLVFGDSGLGPTPGTNTCIFYGDDVSGTVTGHLVNEDGKIWVFSEQTALTTQLTTITHTAPGTPDYALQDLVDSGVGSAFGFATKDEGNTLLSVVANLQARVAELETKLQTIGALA